MHIFSPIFSINPISNLSNIYETLWRLLSFPLPSLPYVIPDPNSSRFGSWKIGVDHGSWNGPTREEQDVFRVTQNSSF